MVKKQDWQRFKSQRMRDFEKKSLTSVWWLSDRTAVWLIWWKSELGKVATNHNCWLHSQSMAQFKNENYCARFTCIQKGNTVRHKYYITIARIGWPPWSGIRSINSWLFSNGNWSISELIRTRWFSIM